MFTICHHHHRHHISLWAATAEHSPLFDHATPYQPCIVSPLQYRRPYGQVVYPFAIR